MEQLDELRMAIDNVLISGVGTETKIEQLVKVMKVHTPNFDPVIIGWLEIYVRAPERNEYIDIRWPDGTVAYERLFSQEIETKMRQRGALWKPAIH